MEYINDQHHIEALVESRNWLDELVCSTVMEGWAPYLDYYEGVLEAVVSAVLRVVRTD